MRRLRTNSVLSRPLAMRQRERVSVLLSSGACLMRALITGANGFVGIWLARTLVERGEQVRALVRRQPAGGALGEIAAEVVTGDVTEMASLGPALRGIEVVFHLAGIRRSPSRQSFF